MNCQIRGLTSIRKGLGKDHIPFPADTKSIIASVNVSGEVYVENQGSLRKAIFTNPEGSQSGGVKITSFLIPRGPNPEGLVFTKPEGSQSGGVLHLLTQRGPKPEGFQFCRSGGVLFLPIRRGTVFVKPEGHYFIKGLRQIEEKIRVRGVRLLKNRLGISDCTDYLPFKKDQTKKKQVQTRIFATLSLEFVTHWCGLKS